jgi:hypothetical protein
LALHLDAALPVQPLGESLSASGTGPLLERLTGVGLETAFGLLTIAAIAALTGYALSALLWRGWIARKRRRRLAAARPAA